MSNLIELIEFVEAKYQNPQAFNFYQLGKWQNISTVDFLSNIRSLSLGLNDLGLELNDGFAIVAKPSPIWLMLDFAAIANRAVSVPIFPDISTNNLLFEINNADVKFVFCDCLENLKIIQNSGAVFKKIIIYGFKYQGNNIISFEDLLENGKKIYQQNPQIFDTLKAKIKEDDLATIIYTSGSTGVPKGVEITHKNLVSQINSVGQCFSSINNSDIALSFLPLAHIFERMVVCLYISKGVSIYFADDVKNVGNLLQEIQPTLMTVVPRMLEKIFAKINNGVGEAPFLKKWIGKVALSRAEKYIPDHNKTLCKLFDYLVYKKLRLILGGNLKMMICGGAPLALNLENFFCGIGINLYIGYGLTESSPVIAVNYPSCKKISTVGKRLSSVQIKIDEEGELLAKGDNIMRGYHKDPQKTNEAIVNGWLKTGDLASIDEEGFVTIIGRKKEMFKTSNGKYVSPVPIEQKIINNLSFLTTACIIAEGKKFVSCLLFPDFEILTSYKKQFGLKNLNDKDFLNSDFLKAHIDKLIDKINNDLNHSEQIKKYYLVDKPISIETGELTPSMKLRRTFVENKYQKVINDFYT